MKKGETGAVFRDAETRYTCEKSGKRIPKDAPLCPSPNNYCEYRHRCVIYELYKRDKKRDRLPDAPVNHRHKP